MRNRSRRELLFRNFRLYAVTDLRDEDGSVLKRIDRAYRGGADIVQLRAKALPDRALYGLGIRIRAIADRRQKLFFVNDRPDLAVAVGADGIHVGQDDLPVEAIRKLARSSRRKFWIGKSTHSLKQALAAQAEGADYIGVGPVFATPTKQHYLPVGLDLIREVSRRVHVPFVAIGGIDVSNLKQVLDAGAARVAVVRAVFSAEDPKHAAMRLRQIIHDHEKQKKS